MTPFDSRLLELLWSSGLCRQGHPPGPDLLLQVEELLQLAGRDPREVVIEALRARKLAADAKARSGRAAEAAEELEKILKGLLIQPAALCRLESLRLEGPRSPRAICRMGGELREVTIHPDVSVDDLGSLRPWEYVCVFGSGVEATVVGTHRDPALEGRALGEIVEFRGYHDAERGLVWISREGRGEEIVWLSPSLLGQRLQPPLRLILFRDDPRWAIGVAPSTPLRSRFEVPIAELVDTRLDDLAGLSSILEPLITDIALRLLRADIQERFDLKPLRGIIFHSYQPGSGKTSSARALSRWLFDLGQERGFDVVLLSVKPNELKNKFHGEDARLVREELCGSVRARLAAPRTRPIFIIILLDEIDSLGHRAGGDDGRAVLSAAQNDIVQALLAEMDGLARLGDDGSSPAAHVLWLGLTNRLDMVDHALKREGRFDLILEVPKLSREGAESVLAVYARRGTVPWLIDDEIRTGLPLEVIRERFLRPALARVFEASVLRYVADGNRRVDVTGGEVMTGVHYMNAINRAKKLAALRELTGRGAAAISFDDVVEGLVEQAASVARQMAADRVLLAKVLKLEPPPQRVELVDVEDLAAHRFVRTESA